MKPAEVVWAATIAALAIAFPVWFYRAYKNVVAFRGAGGVLVTRMGVARVLGPVRHIWRPHSSRGALCKSGGEDDILATSRDGVWWVCWPSPR
jgi:hypothetical protein